MLELTSESRGAAYRLVEHHPDHVEECVPPDDAALITTIVNVMASMASRWSPTHTFLHAGAVEIAGRAALVVGPAESGKSRLVTALLQAGAAYLSDDLSPIDGHLLVSPFPRQISLRAHPVLGPGRFRADSLGFAVTKLPIPVERVLLTSYRPGSVWQPTQLAPGEAVLRLVGNTFAQDRSRTFDRLTDLASLVPVYAGERPEAEEVVRWLMGSMGATPQSQPAGGA